MHEIEYGIFMMKTSASVPQRNGIDPRPLILRREYAPSAGRWLLAAVFLMSGVVKGFHPQPTVKVIGTLFGEWVPAWSVAGLVFLEVLLAAWLVSGFRPRASLVFTITLLFLFSVVLGALLVVNPTSPCGCGLPAISGNGAINNGIGIARNALLIVIAALAWPARLGLHEDKEMQS